jgi:hypothetical protein
MYRTNRSRDEEIRWATTKFSSMYDHRLPRISEQNSIDYLNHLCYLRKVNPETGKSVQDTPFVVSGDFEVVAPYAEALQEADKHIPVRRSPRTRKVAQAAIESVTAPIQTGPGRDRGRREDDRLRQSSWHVVL